jgi:hypothetical protein
LTVTVAGEKPVLVIWTVVVADDAGATSTSAIPAKAIGMSLRIVEPPWCFRASFPSDVQDA